MTTLVRVVAPHFVAGFIASDNRVIDAAPILRFLVGWESQRVRAYMARKGWRASILPDARAPHTAPCTLAQRHPPRAQGTDAMSHQWPDNPDEPQPIQQPPQETPTAPHTPESPRETPAPDDADNGDAEPA